ncbi:Hint domain-containing protein [Vitiosangium sp. GDMCC 1.1324]|uniref:Hint domain-containing protein n=1 Tax=Vitiosangium sp. (strain GDMCC 1.1324) TaxID=2138576 RepID=UPI000D35C1CF|nr:Hint domain-containing protein [Vitiosangium sp. GDMCC 1.1324]PTL77079.1 hypothetical protein DAT35_46405 [Vitiosangium sp. GDMCC 1.1324]
MGFKMSLSQWKPFIRAAQLSGLALLSAGWSTALQPLSNPVERQELLALSPEMSALYDSKMAEGGDRISIELDLSNDAQHGFLMRRLKAAGKNEKNSPELFRKMTQIRERALARKSQNTAANVQTAAGGIWCDHYLVVKPPIPGNNGQTMTYEPYVHVSCEGGANYVYADIVAYDTNQAETVSKQVASDAGEEYGNGTDFVDVGTVATVNVAEGHLLRLESVALAIDDVTGRDVSLYTVARTSIALREDGGFTLIHPREIVANSQADILMCQLRGGVDCDYAVAGYDSRGVLTAYPPAPTGVAASRADVPGVLNPADYWAFSAPYNATRLYLPIRTEIKAGARNYLQCTVDNYTFGKVKLHAEGTTCANSVDFKSQLPVGSYAATFNYLADTSYNINGDNTTGCPANIILNKAASFTITILGKAKCTNADGTYSLEPFYKSQAIDGRALTTQRIFYRNSCMAEGTRIQMADGQVVPVEQVKMGDKVIAGAGGKVLTVTDVARGNELNPFVHLRDSAGHEVTLTEMHPVITAKGEVVAAKNLKVKDQLRTEKGVASLTSVKRVPVNGKRVFNLKLGTTEELAGLDSLGRTMFAGGFLVGDMAMQQELETPAKKPVDVLASLPKAWHQDFKNAQAR